MQLLDFTVVRFLAAIVLGYAAMLVAILALFAVAYPFMGVDRLFEPGTYEAAAGWSALSLGISLVAAMMGGSVCSRIAPASAAPLWLAAIVLVLGGLFAMPVVAGDDAGRGGTRMAGSTMQEAMAHAKEPAWVALLTPLIGVVGVLSGAGTRAIRR